jgi:hypothetical protein
VSAILTVRVGTGSARAELTRGMRVLWAAESAFATPDELRDAITQLAAGESMPVRAARLRVELGAPVAQLRTLRDLPPVRSSHLKALVATQSGRFFRRNGKPLVTDAAWPGSRTRGSIAYAAAVEEPWIEAILEGARAGGSAVESIRPAGIPAGVRLQLLSPQELSRRRRREWVAVGRLGAMGAVAFLAAAAVWGIRFERERRSVEREIERLGPPAIAISGARRALSTAAELVDSMETGRRERGRALAELAALSAGLPDSAYATSFSLEGGGGRLGVIARRSAEVTARLDQVPFIASPRIEGSVVREVAGGRDWERFTVRFEAAR